jgi:hypothetical protein
VNRIFLSLLLLSAALAADGAETGTAAPRGLEFFGSLYTDAGLYHYLNRGEKDSALFSGVSVLALRFRNVNRTYAKVEGDFEVVLPYGTLADLLSPDRNDSALAGAALYGMGTTPLLFDIRKLYLECYLPFADIALGRQIINFGKGVLFSPLDVFSSVQIMDLNFRRNGSTVASARIPLGDLTGIDCIVEAPIESTEHSSAARLFTTVAGWDVSAVTLYRHGSEEVLLGTAFKGDAVAGLYGELVQHLAGRAGKGYFEGMAGADYSIHNTWFFNAEYFYRDRCGAGPLSLWGHHNLYASVQFAPSELVRLSITGIHGFEDRRTISMLGCFYNVLQNADLVAYIRGYDNLRSIGAPDLQYAVRVEVKF